MSEMAPTIKSSRHESVGIIELARPAISNCLSISTFTDIDSALSDFEQSPAIRSVLFLAQGKHFCTGAELGEVKDVRRDETRLKHFLAHGHDVLRRIESSRLPAIAAVQGLCLAGGLELMLACDVVFAASSARFGDQHAQFGLVPGWGGSQRLPRLIGLRRAMDLYYSARWIDADTAERWGLVNHVIGDSELRHVALKFALSLAERSAAGLALMKRLARDGLEVSLAEGLALEEHAVFEPLRSEDVSEGLRAFEERRKPNFG